jgi:Uma2 family endonuclease
MAVATVQSDQRVVLRNVTWDTYARLLHEQQDQSSPRLTYDHGTLEIMSPIPLHEQYKRAFESIADLISDATGIEIDSSFGSSTFSREDLERGFEPDTCLYIQNAEVVRGKPRLDLTTDPPPDVVVEIEISRPAVPKLSIFEQFGVPEVWRFNEEQVQILVLNADGYTAASASRALPMITAPPLTELLARVGEEPWIAWRRRVRAWARTLTLS